MEVRWNVFVVTHDALQTVDIALSLDVQALVLKFCLKFYVSASLL